MSRFPASTCTVIRPRDVEQALRWLQEDPTLTPLAGCTDLFVQMHAGTLEARRFIDLWSLTELRGIAVHRDLLVIGALTTYREMASSRLVESWVPMLAQASRLVGGPQVQNRGTIGGNVANASPAGDTLPVLAVAEAVVVLASADGTRRVRFAEFFTGYRSTVRGAQELIAAFEVPRIPGQQWFRKVGTRAAQAISKVVFAGVRGERVVRVALGSVAPTVVRLPATEATLLAALPMTTAAESLAAEIAPIDDARSTAAYRRQVAQNLLRRFWAETA